MRTVVLPLAAAARTAPHSRKPRGDGHPSLLEVPRGVAAANHWRLASGTLVAGARDLWR